MKQQRQRNQVNDTQRANNLCISPRTDNQRTFLNAIRDYEQVFATGPAGTGKTYIATIEACRLYLLNKVSRIVITRPAIPAGGENLGFLPGSLQQKMAPWVLPVMEIIEDCLGKAQAQEALKNGDLEIAPFGYMRGRTFRDSFVIVDEAQNTTREQMELLLTRIGEGSRLVVSGDLKQSDIGKQSGLQVAIDLIKQRNIPAGLVEFGSGDVVRSDLCKLWVMAFESL